VTAPAPLPRLEPGTKRPLLDPSPSADDPWYVNDHTLVRADDGTWHVFGIWHREPAAPLDETDFLHAGGPSLDGPWTVHDPVLPARTEIGETHVWAPHVIRDEPRGRWAMFYAGGTADHTRYRIELASSDDLLTWEHHTEPLFEDGFDARDPMVLELGDAGNLLYYTRTSAPDGGFHEVAVRHSTDLLHWGEPQVAYRTTERGTVGGPCESPFVIATEGGYILFVCESGEYDRTLAFFSPDPTCVEASGALDVDLDEHCAEIVRDGEQTFITGGGWGRGGLTLRPLTIT
jgi:beta-fructofuranosidase